MDYKDELKGIMKEMMTETNTEKMAEKEELLAKSLEANAELKAQVEKLSAAPAQKVIVPVSDTSGKIVPVELYKGYNLKNQGMELSIKDEDKKERIAKFMVDVIKATVNETTDAQGGYLVPEDFENTILAFTRLNSVAMNECSVINMSREVLKIPAENAHLSVAWESEQGDADQSEPTFAMRTLTAKRLSAKSHVTGEFLDDSAVDIVSYLTADFAEAIGQELDAQVFTGTTFTNSVLPNAALDVQLAGAYTTIDHEDFSLALSKLDDRKIVNAKWYMNAGIKHYIRLLADASNRLIYATPGGSIPSTIYEIPVKDVPKIVSAPSTDVPFIVLGNMKNYLLGKRMGMTIKNDPYTLMGSNIVRFICHSRWDGCIANNGFCTITTAAA